MTDSGETRNIAHLFGDHSQLIQPMKTSSSQMKKQARSQKMRGRQPKTTQNNCKPTKQPVRKKIHPLYPSRLARGLSRQLCCLTRRLFGWQKAETQRETEHLSEHRQIETDTKQSPMTVNANNTDPEEKRYTPRLRTEQQKRLRSHSKMRER